MIFANYILLLLLLSYFILLIFRVVLEKMPIDPLILTGIITSFFFFNKLIIFSLPRFVKIYKSFIKNPKETSKLKIYIEKKIEIFQVFIFETFFQTFLLKKPVISLISLTFFKFFMRILKKPKMFLYFYLGVPWIIFIALYFLEILTGSFLVFCLYLLAYNFLAKNLLKIILYCANFEFLLEAKKSLKTNFSLFWGENLTTSFFLANPLIKSHFFFHEPLLKNKRMLLFLWNTFSEITYFHLGKIFIDFFQIDFKNFVQLQTKVNIIIFSNSFLLLALDHLGMLVNLIVVFSIFLSSLLVGCCCINYLIVTQPSSIFLKDYLSVTTHFDRFWVNTKNELLQNNLFLLDSDLKPFVAYKSIFQYHKERFLPSKDLLNFQERLLIDKISQKIYDWFVQQVNDNRINFETMQFDAQSHLSDSSTDSKLNKKK